MKFSYIALTFLASLAYASPSIQNDVDTVYARHVDFPEPPHAPARKFRQRRAKRTLIAASTFHKRGIDLSVLLGQLQQKCSGLTDRQNAIRSLIRIVATSLTPLQTHSLQDSIRTASYQRRVLSQTKWPTSSMPGANNPRRLFLSSRSSLKTSTSSVKGRARPTTILATSSRATSR
jgi:hypothetical protein